MRDISSLGIFKVSSSKTMNGCKVLTDGKLETYWQSDGPQPHRITATFPFRAAVESVWIYVDYNSDESYTPSKIAVFAGTCPSDLIHIVTKEFEEPTGWLQFETLDEEGLPIKTNFIQISILSNHQNGKDTHVRLIKISSPPVKPILNEIDPFEFQSKNFTSFLSIR